MTTRRRWDDTASMAAEAVRFTQELIRIPSVNTGTPDCGDGEDQCIAYIADKLAEVGLDTDYYASRPGRGNLRLVLPGDNPEALLLHAHVDVVPCVPDEWTHPPFSGDLIDGWIWGRGAVDMKCFAAMMLAVARHWALSGRRPPRTLVMMWLSDEENNGIWGSRWLVEHHPEWFSGVSMALSEVGGFSVTLPGYSRRIYPLAVAEKGVAWLHLHVTGTAGHGSRPMGTTVVTLLAKVVAAIGSHSFPLHLTPAVTALVDAVAEVTGTTPSPDQLESAAQHWGFLEPIVRASVRNTATPTQFHSGYAVNVIPGEASATIDCRVLPGQWEDFRDTIEQIVRGVEAEHENATITMEWEEPSSVVTDPQHPFVGVVREVMAQADPEAVVAPYLLPAGTDNKFIHQLGIDCFGFVPLQLPHDCDCFGSFHAVDERVPAAAVEFGAGVLAEITGAV